MLSKTFSVMIFLSFIVAVATGNVSHMGNEMLLSAANSVKLCLSLLGMMSFWSGVMNVFDTLGVFNVLEKRLRGLVFLLYGKKAMDRDTAKCICTSFVSNLLGLSNASLPLGIRSLEHLQKGSAEDIATDGSILFCVLSSFPLQLVPTTLMILRGNFGSENPFDVVPLVWICNILTQIFALVLCKCLAKTSKRKRG